MEGWGPHPPPWMSRRSSSPQTDREQTFFYFHFYFSYVFYVNRSFRPSMVHWLSSSIFPCSSRYGNIPPNLHFLAALAKREIDAAMRASGHHGRHGCHGHDQHGSHGRHCHHGHQEIQDNQDKWHRQYRQIR